MEHLANDEFGKCVTVDEKHQQGEGTQNRAARKKHQQGEGGSDELSPQPLLTAVAKRTNL